jgi:hypothetical protein
MGLVGAIVYASILVIWMVVFFTQRTAWGASADSISLIIPKGY